MAEEMPFTPPPPPPPVARAAKPVPPPPPTRAAVPPPPPPPTAAPFPPINKPINAGAQPIPRPMTPAPSPFPPMPGAAAPAPAANSAFEQRFQEMERRFREQEESKKAMESQVRDLEHQLKDEHEKVILQSLKAKEEENLSVRVEQQLREMQEKLRREKYEIELQESRGKAESQIKDLERRITEERETWMVALKNQLKEREAVEREVEQNLTHRLHEFERHYQEEKNEWTLSLRQKEEELNQLRRHFELELEKVKQAVDDKDEQMATVKEVAAQERRTLEAQHLAELRAVQAESESHVRDSSSWKAQIALLQSQLGQMETQHQQDRARWHSQKETLDHDHLELRKRLETQTESREEDLKREFARRDQERAHYWEGVISQLRAEKESLRAAIKQGEEGVAHVRIELADAKRQFEIERSQWQADLEKTRRAVREETLRDLPVTVEARVEAEHKRWLEVHQQEVDRLNQKLAEATDRYRILEESSRATDLHRQSLMQEVEQKLATAIQARVDGEAQLIAVQKFWQEKHEHTLEEHRQKLLESTGQLQSLQTQLDTTNQQWDDERAALTQAGQQLQQQLAAATDESQKDKVQWEKQTQEFLHHIAEAQLRESAVREEFEKARDAWTSEKQTLETAIAAALKDGYSKEQQLAAQQQTLDTNQQTLQTLQQQCVELQKGLDRLQKRQDELLHGEADWKKKEDQWKLSQAQLKEAFGRVEAQLVQLQQERSQRESEWEKQKTELLKTAVSPNIKQAATEIRQQMQEMQSLVSTLKRKAA